MKTAPYSSDVILSPKQSARAKDRIINPHAGFVGVSGLGFLAVREGRFFFRCVRFFGAESLSFVAVLVLVDPEGLVLAVAVDSGPKPKNAPGNERVLVFFDEGLDALPCLSRCWLRFRPDLRRRDLRLGAMGFEVSATNQSFPGQTTGIL